MCHRQHVRYSYQSSSALVSMWYSYYIPSCSLDESDMHSSNNSSCSICSLPSCASVKCPKLSTSRLSESVASHSPISSLKSSSPDSGISVTCHSISLSAPCRFVMTLNA